MDEDIEDLWDSGWTDRWAGEQVPLLRDEEYLAGFSSADRILLNQLENDRMREEVEKGDAIVLMVLGACSLALVYLTVQVIRWII